MKKIIILGFLIFIPWSGMAETKAVLLPEQLAFWKKFQSAVVQNDSTTVTALTRFPFLYPNEMDAVVFLKTYPRLFDAKTKACFANGKPIPDEGFFIVMCGGNAFLFGPGTGGYQFFSVESRD